MKKVILITSLILLCLLCGGIGFGIGYVNAPQPSSNDAMYTETFYATVSTISEKEFVAEGLEINDINHRGTMVIAADENTVYEWRHTQIRREELEAGDTIAITYGGEVAEMYPPVYHGILKVQLLDDEK